MTISEKAAYLKGLAEGLGVEKDSRDGKLWTCLTDLISDMAHEIEDLQNTTLDFADTLDEFSEDLTYLEEITCDLDTLDDFQYCEDECDGNCEECEDCGACGMYDEDDAKLVAFADYSDSADEEFTLDTPDEEDAEDIDDEDASGDEDPEPEFDGIVYDVICPVCGEEISFDEETLNKGSIECPNCKELLEFDLSGDEE